VSLSFHGHQPSGGLTATLAAPFSVVSSVVALVVVVVVAFIANISDSKAFSSVFPSHEWKL